MVNGALRVDSQARRRMRPWLVGVLDVNGPDVLAIDAAQNFQGEHVRPWRRSALGVVRRHDSAGRSHERGVALPE